MVDVFLFLSLIIYMSQSVESALKYAETWIDIIKSKKRPDTKKSEWIITESLHNFAEHFNK